MTRNELEELDRIYLGTRRLVATAEEHARFLMRFADDRDERLRAAARQAIDLIEVVREGVREETLFFPGWNAAIECLNMLNMCAEILAINRQLADPRFTEEPFKALEKALCGDIRGARACLKRACQTPRPLAKTLGQILILVALVGALVLLVRYPL